MKPPFTSSQEMYNYAANQLINQNLSQETVKNNLMERGVTDADAEIVIQNMMVVIEKNRKSEGSSKKEEYSANNYGSFTTSQEMYNYAANQLIVQKLSQQAVKRNLLSKGVSDAQAEIVIDNMMVQIEKNRPPETKIPVAETRRPVAKTRTTAPSPAASVPTSLGAFPTSQDMYNYAAEHLIVKKKSQKTVKGYLVHHGVSEADAEVVMQNLAAEIEKNKPAKRAEGKRMMLIGFVIGTIGAVLYGANFTIAGESFVVSYGLLVAGAIFFFKGLFRLF